jgi:hypothetical protein
MKTAVAARNCLFELIPTRVAKLLQRILRHPPSRDKVNVHCTIPRTMKYILYRAGAFRPEKQKTFADFHPRRFLMI